MTRVFAWAGCAAIMVATMTCCQTASAQMAVLNAVYGQGIHAFNDHHYTEAHQLFTTAIANGYQDPRAYYFRGFAADSMGRQYEAEADWQAGAELEASGRINGDIGKSLARMQGSRRVKLERIRQQARVQALITKAARSQIRRTEIGQAATVQPAVAAPPAPTVVEPSPFADDLAGEAEVQSDDVLDVAVEETPAADAFADPAPAPAVDDPFGEAPAEAGGDLFGDEDESDPFADDPFGGF